ncbi:MAG: Mu transposase domain-containing protein [Longimicrobiales bacterium]
MTYREVTMIEVKEILRLWLAGVPKQRISGMLGVDRKTIRRYIALAAAHGLEPLHGPASLTEERLVSILLALKTGTGRLRGEGWELCAARREFISNKLKSKVKLSKIRTLLARDGVLVSYATLRRFAVSELDFGKLAATIPVADPEGGREVQLDTGWVGSLEPDLFGKRRRFRAWIFTPALSRFRFVWPVFQETTASAIEACEEAWDFYGGIFHVLIPDNTKAIVALADPLGARINAAFLEYAQARAFHIDPARARSPRDKARVERTVPTVRDACFGGEVLQELEDARRRARHWCLEEYGMRRHSTTRRYPLEHFEAEEKPQLLPAPSERYDIPLWRDPKVARDQHAQVDRALYSLPRPYVGKVLRARADRSTVRFYEGSVLVKTHPRMLPGRRSTDPSDFPPEKSAYALRDINFLQQQATQHGAHIGQLAAVILEGPLPWTRMRRVYALLGLVRKYGAARVEEASATALAFEMHDVRRLERMLKNGSPIPAAPAPTNVIPLARYLRPASQYALPFAQRERMPTNHNQNGEER